MKIGIVGSGKMGQEIFNYLVDYKHEIILICRTNEKAVSLNEKFIKQLNKKVKRDLISLEEAEQKKQDIEISCDLKRLRECDLVIETVIEDKTIKKELFVNIEQIVKEDCILATNTSSLSIPSIFEGCSNKERCLGLHFFYPMKINSVVEINKLNETKSIYIEIINKLMLQIKRTVLELHEEAHTIISRILTSVSSYIYGIYTEGYLSVEQIDALIKERIMLFGTFELINCTGLCIMKQCLENFKDSRYKMLYDKLYNAIQQAHCMNKDIITYEAERSSRYDDTNDIEEYKEKVVLRIKAFILNEVIYNIHEKHVDSKIIRIIQEAIGLYQTPKEILDEIGISQVEKILEEEYAKTKDEVFKMESYSMLLN